MFGGRVVTALLQVGLHLVLHLGLVQVPGVLLLGVLPSCRVRSSSNLIDGARLLEDLVRKLLSCGQNLSVVRRDQILDEFLKLLPVHLQESLADGNSHRDLVRVPDPEDGEGHHMLAPEDVATAAGAGDARDLASEHKLQLAAEQSL